ncbi:unnamed protein product, partial [Oncorhynchus mykiss]
SDQSVGASCFSFWINKMESTCHLFDLKCVCVCHQATVFKGYDFTRNVLIPFILVSDGSEETGSDKILAFAVSSSAKLVALTDDTKRLVLFRCEPSWQVISTRWVVRRCTSLVFTEAEDEVWAADKSGDVYSFSVVEPQKTGELKLGHLSMLLSMTLTPNDKYVVTADRDEKIRVSHLRSPHNIQAFCLGHLEFVSSLLAPPGHPQWLLSGSGDGTMKLWEYESGRRLQSWDLKQLRDMPNSDTEKEKVTTLLLTLSVLRSQLVSDNCLEFVTATM